MLHVISLLSRKIWCLKVMKSLRHILKKHVRIGKKTMTRMMKITGVMTTPILSEFTDNSDFVLFSILEVTNSTNMMVIIMEGTVEIMLNLEAAETKETISMTTIMMTIKINY